MKLIFATGNAGKLREAREILGPDYEIISLKDLNQSYTEPEETGSTFMENSLIKADSLWKTFGLPCFADDSGMEVDALGGEPGIYSARYAGSDKDFSHNINKVLKNMEGIANRAARFRCVVTLITDGTPHFFDGTLEGRIGTEPHGDGGFGYDPIFYPNQWPDKTLSQVDEEAKNSISHRGAALRAMAEFLKKANNQD